MTKTPMIPKFADDLAYWREELSVCQRALAVAEKRAAYAAKRLNDVKQAEHEGWYVSRRREIEAGDDV